MKAKSFDVSGLLNILRQMLSSDQNIATFLCASARKWFFDHLSNKETNCSGSNAWATVANISRVKSSCRQLCLASIGNVILCCKDWVIRLNRLRKFMLKELCLCLNDDGLGVSSKQRLTCVLHTCVCNDQCDFTLCFFVQTVFIMLAGMMLNTRSMKIEMKNACASVALFGPCGKVTKRKTQIIWQSVIFCRSTKAWNMHASGPC